MGDAPELTNIDLTRLLKFKFPPAEYFLADKMLPLDTLITTMKQLLEKL